MMDRGLLSRHLQETSTLQEMSLSIVPYWLVGVAARTSLIASDVVVEGATLQLPRLCSESWLGSVEIDEEGSADPWSREHYWDQ